MKKYFFNSFPLLIMNIIVIVSCSIVTIYMAYILQQVTDISYSGNLEQLKNMFFIMLIYSILTFLTTLAKRILKIKLIKDIMYNLKNDIFNSIIAKNISSFNSSNTASYISAINNDTSLIEQDYFSSIIDNVDYILTFVFATYSIFKLNIYVALSILITGFLPLLIPVIFQKELGFRRKSYSDMTGSFTGKIKDIFSGFEVIKSFNIEDKISEDFYNANNSLELKKYKSAEFIALINTISIFLGFIMYFAPLAIGVYLVLKGQFTTGGVIASVQLSNHVVNPISNLSNIISRLKSIKPINEKIETLIFENNLLDKGLLKEEFLSKISFENINFSYNEDRKILNNISLEINKGEKVAIVGSSGSGKSTFLKLLLRYYENYTGSIKLDNIDSKDLNLNSLYSLISIIQQNVFMFDDTVESNISLYGNYSEDDINKAINLSGLTTLIENLPNGKKTLVGENGSNLSGGEKQRISIARALIKNTPIILLDEATASLDSKTAYDIEMSLLSIENLTSIVITHKLNEEILRKYDKIIVLEKGNLVEFGHFDQLIKNNSFFYKLFTIEKAA